MKFIQILKNILQEKQNQQNEFGCVMLDFYFPEIEQLHKVIYKDDLYEVEGDLSYGVETEPHTVLLYGLHRDEIGPGHVYDIVKNKVFSPCIMKNPSLFRNELFDVLKFDVEGKNLHETNKALKKLPHTSKFPNYHPHLTIAYLTPSTGEKYVSMLRGREYELTPTKIIYNPGKGKKEEFPIKIQK